jgi:hypothetical protein
MHRKRNLRRNPRSFPNIALRPGSSGFGRTRQIISEHAPHPQNSQHGIGEAGIQGIAHQGRRVLLFLGGEAADWLDRILRMLTLHALTLDQGIDEFQKLTEKNQQVMGAAAKSETSPRPKGVFTKGTRTSPEQKS